jgi:hypothetical protein
VVAPTADVPRARHAGVQALELVHFRAWALFNADGASTLWPAFRTIGMHAPEAPDQLRLLAFGVLWRFALDELADGLIQRLAVGHSLALARVPTHSAR